MTALPARLVEGGLSVVVPVYDEEPNVVRLGEEILAALDPLSFPFEAIFVDDGSRDGTSGAVRSLGARDPRVRLVRLEKNAGQSAATVAGVRSARHAFVATLDGDGQNDPADLPKLLAALDQADAVVGRRAKRRDTVVRRLSSRIANGVRRSILHDGVADTGCALKVFPRDLFLALPAFTSLHRFLPALFRYQGASIAQVDVGHRPRIAGVSKYGIANRLFRGILDLAGVWWLRRRTVRYRISPE